jgi:3-methyladenine DNA glycosylase AlkD
MNSIIEKVSNFLIETGSEENRQTGLRYFKEDIKLRGVKSAEIMKISNSLYSEINHLNKKEIFEICTRLWQTGYFEEGIVACEWSYKLRKQYEPADFGIFEIWIANYVTNWATCDTLCNHTVGDFLMMYPDFLEKLKIFAVSPNRWMRRAAAVSLIVPARKGLFLSTIFELAEILLTDKDDLVQKGYGWMLKAASQAHEQEVFEFVVKRKDIMPRTALRYAIEKMPAELKKIAMAKN